METIESIENQPSQKEPRPSFLTVLSILSFIFIGFSILFGLFGIATGPMNADQLLESSVQISKSADEMRSLDMESFAVMMEQIGRMTVSINNHFYVNGILSLVVMITGLIGVIKMMQGHKIGFHLYIIYSLITIGQLYIFVSPADIPSFVVIWNLVISGIFVLMYSRNLKWLK